MAQQTELQPNAMPGQRHSFAAKDEAAEENNHPVDWITYLQPYSLPGIRRTFAAKTEASVGFPYSHCVVVG